MKKSFCLIIALIAPLLLSAQELEQRNVPAVVLNTFQLGFTNASDIEWRLEKGYFHVRFEVNEKDNELIINDKGVVIKHLQDLYISEIPANVLGTIKKKVAQFDIGDADLIEENGRKVYSISMEIDDKDYEFRITERGTLLRFFKELKISEIPQAAADLIRTGYGKIEIDNADYVEENSKISYVIEGEINDLDHLFEFDEKSSLTKHVQELKTIEVPAEVLNSVRTLYSGFELRKARRTQEDNKSTYMIEMRRGKETVYVTFDPTGKVVTQGDNK
jgi:uncharacterized membrane protein YkoI